MQIREKQGLNVAVIGDRDTVTGFLLCGIGDLDREKRPNFLVYDSKTSQEVVEATFERMTNNQNIAVIIINQHIANTIRHLIDSYDQSIPTIVEIPSKNERYNFEHDFIMSRISKILGR